MDSNIFQWRSLKTRVTLFTLSIFLVSFWLLAFYTNLNLRNDMQRLLGEQQFSTVSLIAAEVNHELETRFRVLKKVAGSISPATLDHPPTLQAFLEESLILQEPFNGGIFVSQREGVTVARLPFRAESIGVSYTDRDYMVSALKEGKATIGRPVIGKVLQTPVFVMAVPISDTQGTVIGVLAGVTDLGQPNFLDQIMQNCYGQSGSYLLIAPQHRLVITASDKKRIMEMLPAAGVNPLIDRFLEGYEGSGVIVNPHGVEVLASDKGIPVAGWIAAAVLPTVEAFAPIRAMQQRMWTATMVLTLLAGGMTWQILRHLLSPMLTAARTLSAWSTTYLPPQPLLVANQDEIGDLIGGFNRLLDILAERETAIRQLALYDPLTQLPNRRLLNDRLRQTMLSSNRHDCYSALMFIDLDNFKPINDLHGHAVGDLLLIEAAHRLQSCVRETDTVARFGGDEFVVILSDLHVDKAQSISQAEGVAQKIMFFISEPYRLTVRRDGQKGDTVEHQCTASIGVAVFINHEGSPDNVLKAADMAMYQAKEAGRNSIRFYHGFYSTPVKSANRV